MAKKTVTFSIDEEIIKKIEHIVKDQVGVQNKSHLVEILVMKEYAKMQKGKLWHKTNKTTSIK